MIYIYIYISALHIACPNAPSNSVTSYLLDPTYQDWYLLKLCVTCFKQNKKSNVLLQVFLTVFVFLTITP